MNYKTRCPSDDEYRQIVATVRDGFKRADGTYVKASPHIFAILVLQAGCGLRIGDVVKIRLNNFCVEATTPRIRVIEDKTSKIRDLPISMELYSFILEYAVTNGVKPNGKLFDVGVRAVQHHLKLVCDHLGITSISTHSLRKRWADKLYQNSGKDIVCVQQGLNHSSLKTTQHYLSVDKEKLEQVLTSYSDMLI